MQLGEKYGLTSEQVLRILCDGFYALVWFRNGFRVVPIRSLDELDELLKDIEIREQRYLRVLLYIATVPAQVKALIGDQATATFKPVTSLNNLSELDRWYLISDLSSAIEDIARFYEDFTIAILDEKDNDKSRKESEQ